MTTLRFPSKTFLLGEYAVLRGAPALLLGHAPFFEAEISPSPGAGTAFHPESPAGTWLAKHPFEGCIQFRDPHHGKGGFGGSGAEFLSAWAAEQEVPSVTAPRAIFAWGAWEESRSLPGAGSGADILTQAFGVNRAEAFFLEVDLADRQLHEIFPRKHQGRLALFHTGRKLATHAAQAPASLPLEEMADCVYQAGTALEGGAVRSFAEAVNRYAEILARLGLVAEHTAQALPGLRALPGVLAAKGCGAMGADVILAVHEEGADFGAWAQANSLTLVGQISV